MITVSFWGVTLLHVVIWDILIDQIDNVERETVSHVGSDECLGLSARTRRKKYEGRV